MSPESKATPPLIRPYFRGGIGGGDSLRFPWKWPLQTKIATNNLLLWLGGLVFKGLILFWMASVDMKLQTRLASQEWMRWMCQANFHISTWWNWNVEKKQRNRLLWNCHYLWRFSVFHLSWDKNGHIDRPAFMLHWLSHMALDHQFNLKGAVSTWGMTISTCQVDTHLINVYLHKISHNIIIKPVFSSPSRVVYSFPPLPWVVPFFSDQKTVLRWVPHFRPDQVLGIVPGRKVFANQTSTMQKTTSKNEHLETPKWCFENGDAFWTCGHLMVSSRSISGGVYFGNASWTKIPRWHAAATHDGWGKKDSELGVKSLSFEVTYFSAFFASLRLVERMSWVHK